MENKKGLIIPALVLALIGAAFAIGRLSAKLEYLSKGSAGTVAGTQQQQQGVAQAAPETTPLGIDNLKAYAKDLKLDSKKFDSCLDDGKYAQKVKDDSSYGATVGVSGTPTFFINGVIVVGAQPQAEFEKVIDAELKDGSGDKVTADGKRVEVKTGVGYIDGSKNAKVKVVEFSDFECPFCARAFPTIKALQAKYGDKLSLEYRHYPLPFHPNAQKAAEASECAGEQGKFWQMHDKMFGQG